MGQGGREVESEADGGLVRGRLEGSGLEFGADAVKKKTSSDLEISDQVQRGLLLKCVQ